MTKHELAAVAVRLFALAIILYVVTTIPGYFAFGAWAEGAAFGAKLFIASTAFLLLVAVGMWRFPKAIAALLMPRPITDEQIAPWSKKDVLETASIVIGLFYLFYALSDAVHWLAFSVALSHESSTLSFTAEHKAAAFTTVIEVAMAFVLIFGARHITSFILRLRYAH